MKTPYLLAILIALPLSIYSQPQRDDITLITQTVNNYYNGYIERDIEKLYQAFDTENGTMKVPLDSKNPSKGFKNVLFKTLVPKWGNRAQLSTMELQNCALHILNIDVESGQIASVKMSMKVGDTTYIDILSLHVIDSIWKITNKIYLSK